METFTENCVDHFNDCHTRKWSPIHQNGFFATRLDSMKKEGEICTHPSPLSSVMTARGCQFSPTDLKHPSVQDVCALSHHHRPMRFNAFKASEYSDSRKQTFEARISRHTKQPAATTTTRQRCFYPSHSPKLSFYYYCIHNFLFKDMRERRFSCT